LVTVGDIAHFLDSMFPEESAESFDNVGLLIGDKDNTVTKIMVMLDADESTIAEAINTGADMIVTHHPFIFSPLKRINDKLILSLIQNKIALYSAHTNLDRAVMGVNDNLAKILDLSATERVMMPDCTLIGVTGYTTKHTFGDFITHLKSKLGIQNVRYTGDLKDATSKIGIIGGSAAEFMVEMKHLGCDTFVTADLKYHQAQQAQQIGINIIDAGHFETENHIISVVAELLKKQFADTQIVVSQRKNSYIKYG